MLTVLLSQCVLKSESRAPHAVGGRGRGRDEQEEEEEEERVEGGGGVKLCRSDGWPGSCSVPAFEVGQNYLLTANGHCRRLCSKRWATITVLYHYMEPMICTTLQMHTGIMPPSISFNMPRVLAHSVTPPSE